MNARVLMTCTVALSATVATACGDDDEVADARAAYCEAVVGVADAARAVEGLTETSSVDGARQAVEDLERSIDAAEGAAGELGEAEVDALRLAFDDLRDSLDALDGSGTLAGAAAQVLDARNTFVLQWEGVAARNCGGALLPTTTTAG